MSHHRYTAVLAVLSLFAIAGCQKSQPPYVVPEAPMPPNTILISQVMRNLAAQPGATDEILSQLDPSYSRVDNSGTALLTPELVGELRRRIVGKNWQGLDRFPGWSMRTISSTVFVLGHVTGTPIPVNPSDTVAGSAASFAQLPHFLDLGPYPITKADTISLEHPSTLPALDTASIVSNLGFGLTRGDGPGARAAEHPENQRLADLLNRLAVNKLDGAAKATATLDGKRIVSTPEDLIAALLASGHTVTVQDTRYFANFAHFHYKGKDVMAPFFINSGMVVPNSGGRPLLVPVAHAELEWHIRGPQINADISYYFGIDGKSEWRTMDTLDQPWVLHRVANTYAGDQAVEVTRISGLLTVAYMHLHFLHPSLPFGGYYGLGVCQDGVSAIEKKMTGQVTLFPNTADGRYFTDPRDVEVNSLIAAIPKDQDAGQPDPARVFGSLPVTPSTDAEHPFDSVTIPGLADDLNACYIGWKTGGLEKPRNIWGPVRMLLILFGSIFAAIFLLAKAYRHLSPKPMQRKGRY
jgi:hypothetical protein